VSGGPSCDVQDQAAHVSQWATREHCMAEARRKPSQVKGRGVTSTAQLVEAESGAAHTPQNGGGHATTSAVPPPPKTLSDQHNPLVGTSCY
jgi:poly(3-hydroxybutyrate) depolymerase